MNPLLIKAAGMTAFVALAAFSKCTYDGRRRAEGREQIAIAARQAAEQELRRLTIPRVDSFYVRDTVRLWRRVVSTQTLIDTLRLSDTVTLTKRESVLVFVADSLVTACRTAISSCEVRVLARDSLLSVLTTDRNFWRGKAEPSLLTRFSTALKWAAIGYVAGRLQ